MSKPHKVPKLANWGLWLVDEAKVKYLSRNSAIMTCEHLIKNGETESVYLSRTIWDRLTGLSFDEKVDRKFKEFRQKMERRNHEILVLRAKESALNNKQL